VLSVSRVGLFLGQVNRNQTLFAIGTYESKYALRRHFCFRTSCGIWPIGSTYKMRFANFDFGTFRRSPNGERFSQFA
jgi:hypothetical protein